MAVDGRVTVSVTRGHSKVWFGYNPDRETLIIKESRGERETSSKREDEIVPDAFAATVAEVVEEFALEIDDDE